MEYFQNQFVYDAVLSIVFSNRSHQNTTEDGSHSFATIDASDITFQECLGDGLFGSVFASTLRPTNRRVAKKANDGFLCQ